MQPVKYYNNLPNCKETPLALPELAIIIDPLIATGATMRAAIETVRDWGVPKIVVIAVLANEDGLRTAAESWPEGVEIWVGGVDLEIDANGMIKPGLGNIGNRLFLTRSY